ncbi:hypothetical protein E2562_019771 [Oryza meyeriana var. granulata]|uniref:Epidermal patterning factor-like protein n=1 Tax=Oryza meyeriana var. granulata TaxID=110450 RepID=A0A6G1DL78_9ORYZ|nr:hypothetical protein E2562_019771 [Oryza meyeriana var. granulata]
MASAAAKLAAVLCMLVVAAQLKTASSTSTRAHVDDATSSSALLGQLQELDEEVRLAEELVLLDDDGDSGATICPSNCQKCLVKCAGSCVVEIISPPTFVACFLKCAVTKVCFGKM